jgi:hypothetical protein
VEQGHSARIVDRKTGERHLRKITILSKRHGSMMTKIPPRIQKLMEDLPANRRVRNHLGAWDLSPELRMEIQDYFNILESSEDLCEKFNLHRWVIFDVLLLGMLICIPGFRPPFKTICSPGALRSFWRDAPGTPGRKNTAHAN